MQSHQQSTRCTNCASQPFFGPFFGPPVDILVFPDCQALYENTYNQPLITIRTGLFGHAKDFYGRRVHVPQVAVPCGPLTPVLIDIFGSERISFFSLDVEGAQVMVLYTLGFSKVHIDVLMINQSRRHYLEDLRKG
jgi:hypothetical protein